MTDLVFSVILAAGRTRLKQGGSFILCVGRDCVEFADPFELVESDRACCFVSFRTVGRVMPINIERLQGIQK